MNQIVSLMAKLAEKDIRLWLEDGNLRFSAPEGAMTPDLIAELREHKPAIIEFLQQSESLQRVELPKADRSQPMAVAPAQQRLWFLNQLDPGNTAYHIHAALRIKGALDLNRLNAACSEIVRRHEILHTAYQQVDGVLKQSLITPYAIQLQAEAISADALPAAMDAELKKTFDLSSGVISRARLWQLADDEHVFSFTVHHIAADGWSLATVVGELVALYQEQQQNRAEVLPELEAQYADFALWQAQPEQQQARAQQLEYWQQQLQGSVNLDLPLDRPRSALTASDAGLVECKLDATLTQQLNQFAQQQGATLFMTLMAAYAALLQRYSQQSDFCIGTPVGGRNLSQLEPLIGCFVNVLAIRCEPQAGQSFVECLEDIRNTCTQAFASQDVPFEQIVNELVKERDLSISPIFQTMLSLQNTPVDDSLQIPGLEISPYEMGAAAAQFDLKLTAQEYQQELLLHFEYKTALFDRETVQQLADAFVRLVQSVLQSPEQKLHQIPLFGAEPQQLLGLEPGGINDTAAELPEQLLIHRLFEQQAAVTPHTAAVSDDLRQLSYAELNAEVNRLANMLISSGVAPGQLVGVCVDRSVNMTIALLAVLKAGCAYVPFDPVFPEERLAFMAQDTNIARLLVDRNNADRVAMFCGCSWVLEDLDLSQQSEANPELQQSNDSLFNVIYTSGSTGKPKGVMVPHDAIANRLLWMQKSYRLSAEDKVLQKTPYSFDVSVWELFWPLICGSSYHFARPEGHKDPAYLRELIQQQQISVMHFVPSMLGSFLNTLDIEGCTSLRKVFCSGEALQLEHESRFAELLPQAELHNLYGPTEAAIDVSFFACGGEQQYASVPIGKPIDNIQLHVLDANLNPLPAGVAGELYIGGVGLADGYLNRAEQTASSFIDNPFTGHPSARLYKTGDLVRQDRDGNLLYLGRIDHQVKIRGNRIELGEIEAALMQHTAVREAVVVPQSYKGDKRLVAYCLGYEGMELPDATEFSGFLTSRLPAYMLPVSYMRVDEWPLSPSGKVNRNRLPEPDWQAISDQPYVAPESETEIKLAEIWSEVLGIEKVGQLDNFFQLGGHSLTATQALARAQETFNVEVPLREVFENPTIKAIAMLIDRALLEQSVFSDAPLDDDEEQDSFIL